jgi:hypothetical protein
MLTGSGLLAAALLLPVLTGGVVAASRLADYDSRAAIVPAVDIYALAAGLKDAPAPLRAEFAAAALTEMIADYRQEAERARAELRRQSADRDLPRWSRAVDSMVADLQQLADSIAPDTPVFVSALHANAVYLVVDGSPVLLTGPRSAERGSLEERVVQRFCSRNDCSLLLEEDRVETPPPVKPEEPPVWRFGDAAGPTCVTGDGLEFQFRNTSGLNEKREACDRIVAELNTLAAALALQADSGTAVEWNSLSIRPFSGADVQSVVLNNDGDFLLLPVPSLAESPELFRLVLPWVAAKVDGRRYNLVVLNMERLLGMAAE